MRGFLLSVPMYYVYAIAILSKNYIYVGLSHEPDVRIKRHNDGRNRTTAPYAPFRVLKVEEVGESRSEARQREKFWKSGMGREKLRRIRDEK